MKRNIADMAKARQPIKPGRAFILCTFVYCMKGWRFHIIIWWLCLWGISPSAFGQCNSDFIHYDSIGCDGQDFVIEVDTPGFNGTTIIDFCDAPASVFDTTSILGDFSVLSNPQSISLVQDDSGNWFGFVKDINLSSLVRFDFGSSLQNTPTSSSVTVNSSLSLNSTSRSGIEFMKLNGNWYGLAATTAERLFILEFGTDFTQNTINAIAYSNPGGNLFNPACLDPVFIDDSLYVFIMNQTGVLSILNFGQSFDSLQSATTNTTFQTAGYMTNARAIEVIVACGNIHVFGGDRNTARVAQLNFGNSVNNTPAHQLLTSDALTAAEMKSTFSGGKYQLWVKTSHSTRAFTRIEMDNTLTNVLNVTNYANASQVYSGYGFDLVYVDGHYEVMTTLNSPASINWLRLADSCQATTPFAMGDSAATQFSDTGTFAMSVHLVDSNAFRHTYYVEAPVFYAPSADFDFDGFCVGVPTSFSDSTGSVYGLASWEWDFGTNDTAQQQHPSYTYADTGSYQIGLVVGNIAGCQDSAYDSITIHPSPVANFGTSLSCQGKNTVFTDSSTVLGGTITQSLWLFPSIGDTLSGLTMVTAFDSNGLIGFSHVAISDQGCVDTVSGSIDVLPSPVVDIDIGSTCFGDTTEFVNNTQSSIPYTHFWHFDDGSANSTAEHELHYYADTGTYGFYYIATGQNQCADTLSLDLRISVTSPISLQLPPTNVCEYEVNDFLDITDYSPEVVNFRIWSSDTDSIFANPAPFQFDSAQASKNMALQTVIGTNCAIDTTFSIRILEGVTAQFVPEDLCHEDTVTFRDTSLLPADQQIASTLWKFGDGSTGSGYPIDHSYIDPGLYNVTYVIESDSGCESSIAYDIRVVERPVIDLSFDNLICSGLELGHEVLTTIDPDDMIDSVWWGFQANGMDTTLADDEGSVIVPFSGAPLLVSYYLETRQGCSEVFTDSTTAIQSPVVDFSFDTACAGSYTQLTDNYEGSNYDWNWFINNTYNLVTDDPAVLFPGRGAFPVTLTLTDITGCWDSLTKDVIVSAIDSLWVATFGFCEGSVGQLTVEGDLYHDEPSFIEWSVNGTDQYFGSTAQFPLNDGTEYGYLLEYHTKNGCVSFFEGIETAEPSPEISIQTTREDVSNLTFTFETDGDSTLEHVSWFFGDGASRDSIAALHTYSTLGQYNVEAWAVFANGCQATATKRLNVGDVTLQLHLTDFQFKSLTEGTGFSATMVNTGLITVESAQLSLGSEKGERVAEHWSGSLAPQQSLTFDLATEVLDLASFYCLELTTANDSVGITDEVLCIRSGDALTVSEVFPNPTDDQTSLYIYTGSDVDVELSLFSVLGSELDAFDYSLTASGFGQRVDINLSALNSGTYILHIEVDNEIFARSIVRR